MVKTTQREKNGVLFTVTTSDEGRFVVRDGVSYVEAVDRTEYGRIYTEGDVIPEEYFDINAETILDILVGGAE